MTLFSRVMMKTSLVNTFLVVGVLYRWPCSGRNEYKEHDQGYMVFETERTDK
jgi:hypothetical protein